MESERAPTITVFLAGLNGISFTLGPAKARVEEATMATPRPASTAVMSPVALSYSSRRQGSIG